MLYKTGNHVNNELVLPDMTRKIIAKLEVRILI
jgi:hypothetical protein